MAKIENTIRQITASDVQFLTENECRDVIGVLAIKQETISGREVDILQACEDRVFDGEFVLSADEDYDDGQPDWEQEWSDFGEVYDDSYNCI